MKEGAIKFDQEKIRIDLISTVAIEELAKVLTYGAKKYTAHNWRSGLARSRLLGAAIRHVFAFMRGEDRDPESGLSHLAHAMCCLMFLLEFVTTGGGTDDRWDELGKMSVAEGRNGVDAPREQETHKIGIDAPGTVHVQREVSNGKAPKSGTARKDSKRTL